MSTTIATLPLATIGIHPDNVRRAGLGDLAELAASIAEFGILQPVTVVPATQRPDDTGPPADEYWILAGHRRRAAALRAGLTEIPAIVRSDLTDRAGQIEAMLIENLQRADLTPLDEARAYEQLVVLEVSPADIAKHTGRASKTVKARLALTRLPDHHQARIDSGQLSLADAELLAKFTRDKAAMEYLGEATGANLRYRAAEWPEVKAARAEAARRQAEEPDAPPPVPAATELGREAERRREEREEERRVLARADAARITWLTDQVRAAPQKWWTDLQRLVLVRQAESIDYLHQDVLTAFGIKPYPDDAEESIEAWYIPQALALPTARQQRLCLLLLADVDETMHSVGHYRERVPQLVEYLGYDLSDDEAALLAVPDPE